MEVGLVWIPELEEESWLLWETWGFLESDEGCQEIEVCSGSSRNTAEGWQSYSKARGDITMCEHIMADSELY